MSAGKGAVKRCQKDLQIMRVSLRDIRGEIETEDRRIKRMVKPSNDAKAKERDLREEFLNGEDNGGHSAKS